ncbi:hypothetical protein CONPUDRAFT_77468 [Coniophora puteana RWD-64-598 SS2]|uniref:Histidine-specific methyltransferase SAM-dependent domain-containing protein n=1 Tax=Coniophora puteana (strain RWD-64-598) TaxID=741705 RepID=A0A5M3M7E6_CONPW|nr:uncharacterized protein CONPUDRAFT_77468 [Coniophora puteana RWD-64-598 SS2]EIW75222.1 hypothetical protein CONPUDRAFT_77468 [Coniophora puteana RWD-64-598 SS2]
MSGKRSALVLDATGTTEKHLLRDVLASPEFARVGEYRRRVTLAEAVKAYVGKEKLEPSEVHAHSPQAGTRPLFPLCQNKGLTELELAALGYKETIVFRPAFLRGAERPERRAAESVFGYISGALSTVSSSMEIPTSNQLLIAPSELRKTPSQYSGPRIRDGKMPLTFIRAIAVMVARENVKALRAVPRSTLTSTIIDVRSKASSTGELRHQTIEGLSAPAGQKAIPSMLLYDERGLQLYDAVTTEAPEYYPFAAEEEILRRHSEDIARAMHVGPGSVVPGETVLELGAGLPDLGNCHYKPLLMRDEIVQLLIPYNVPTPSSALRKTSHILEALSALVPSSSSAPPITYYALDLEKRELERTLNDLSDSEVGRRVSGKIHLKGMHGTYDNGIEFVNEGGLRTTNLPGAGLDLERFHVRDGDALHDRELSPGTYSSVLSGSSSSGSHSPSRGTDATVFTPDIYQAPLHMMFLGSTLGNFERGDDAGFLRSFPLRPGSGDTLLIGLDHNNDKAEIELAYNDPGGHCREFILNGLKAAGSVLGDEKLFNREDWELANQYYEAEHRHESYCQCKRDHSIKLVADKPAQSFLKGETIRIAFSRKFSEKDTVKLFTDAQLRPIQRWTDSSGRYSLSLLERPPFMFPIQPTSSAIAGTEAHFRMQEVYPVVG